MMHFKLLSDPIPLPHGLYSHKALAGKISEAQIANLALDHFQRRDLQFDLTPNDLPVVLVEVEKGKPCYIDQGFFDFLKKKSLFPLYETAGPWLAIQLPRSDLRQITVITIDKVHSKLKPLPSRFLWRIINSPVARSLVRIEKTQVVTGMKLALGLLPQQ